MAKDGDVNQSLTDLLGDRDLAGALDSDHFKQFLDHVPFAIAVAELQPEERITYVNLEFERLSGQPAAELRHQPWSSLKAIGSNEGNERHLSDAIPEGEDHIGSFRMGPKSSAGESIDVDAWSNVIQDEGGTAMFRLVALAPVQPARRSEAHAALEQLHEKDMLLRELQHRVKNNLQMITSLIRLASRQAAVNDVGDSFDRLAGQVSALALLYDTMVGQDTNGSIDLGTYLSQIASAVMKAHAMEGIRLNLKVDSWPVSINVAMPTGLVVNEVLTNALKHAFTGREGGTITLESLVEGQGCTVIIADDGIGLPQGAVWPTSGRLGWLIVESLRQNAGATLDVTSSPEKGVRVAIGFGRADAAPEGVAA